MASENAPSQWFLEVDGKKVGPFTVEQVQGLLRDGEVPPEVRAAASDWKEGRWITVREPVDKHGTASPVPVTRLDPALSLFDALQVARERKAAARSALASSSQASQQSYGAPRVDRVVPRWAWFALPVVVAAVAAAIYFGHGNNEASPGGEALNAAGSAASNPSTPHEAPPAAAGAPAPVHTQLPVPVAPPAAAHPMVPMPPQNDNRDDRDRDDRDVRDDREEAREVPTPPVNAPDAPAPEPTQPAE